MAGYCNSLEKLCGTSVHCPLKAPVDRTSIASLRRRCRVIATSSGVQDSRAEVGPSLAHTWGREGDIVKKLISTFCLAALLLSGGVASAAQVSIGVRIGPPPPPRVVR